MFKRNQVEEAIACVLEPGSAKPSSEMRTRLRRLLETGRRNRRVDWPTCGINQCTSDARLDSEAN